MLVFSRRQDGFRRIESLLSSPNRAIIVQRMVQCRWQTRKSSALRSDRPEEAEVSRDSTFPKRVDSLWKVGASVLGAGGIENTVTEAVSIGSVNADWSIVITPLTRLFRANSFSIFLKSRFYSKSSLVNQSISEFKKRMKQYGYANDMVLPGSRHHHLGNSDRFVSAPPVYALEY